MTTFKLEQEEQEFMTKEEALCDVQNTKESLRIVDEVGTADIRQKLTEVEESLRQDLSKLIGKEY